MGSQTENTCIMLTKNSLCMLKASGTYTNRCFLNGEVSSHLPGSHEHVLFVTLWDFTVLYLKCVAGIGKLQ